MTISTGKRPPHIKDTTPTHPELKRISEWEEPNRKIYLAFRVWLYTGGYAQAARTSYGVAVRLALGLLDKLYWEIHVSADCDQVRDFIATHYASAATRRMYGQGLNKFAALLNMRCRRPTSEPVINWEYYLGNLPDSLAADCAPMCNTVAATGAPIKFIVPHTICSVSPRARCAGWQRK